MIIEIVASVLAIIASLYGFYRWLKPWFLGKRPSRVFVKDANLYLIYPNGDTRQITFLGNDSTPVLGRKKVIFFRGEKIGNSEHPYTRYKLMAIEFASLKETLITDQKPFLDGLNNSYEILQPFSPLLSGDQSHIFFTVEKWATASVLVQVNINTGKWTQLFSTEHFEIIRSGRYKDRLLVGVSEIRDNGRDIYYKVCDFRGAVLLDLGDYDSYMVFRSKAMIMEG